MSGKRHVSLRDIAEKTGVSRMTVSKALRGTSGVSDFTRVRIQEIAKKLGYCPDPQIARAMSAVAKIRRKSTGERLAFLTTHSTPNGWKKFEHILGCFTGASERAREYGYELEPFWALASGKKLADVLFARGIDGILLAPTGPELVREGRRTIDFDWSRASVVEIDEQLDEPVFRVVRHDHFTSMLMALYQLESLGYRRIGFAAMRRTEARNRHRWSSAYFLWSNIRCHKKALPPFLYDEPDPAKIRKWVEDYEIDAVLGLPDEFLMLTEAGFHFPESLGFALLDCHSIPGTDVKCSGIDQKSYSIGVAAIDLLAGLVRIRETGAPQDPTQLMVEGAWVSGDTVRRIGEPLEDRSLYEIKLPLGPC